jgi:hypothetical protein
VSDATIDMETQVFEEGSVAIEVSRFETSSGPRLRLRDLRESTEIFLDPLELEGLTRIRGGGLVLGQTSGDGEEEAIEAGGFPGEVFQNEFAMVTVGWLDRGGRTRLVVRDLASRAEAYLRPVELKELTRLKHRQFAGLLDPSELVAAAEPDPDQV